MTREEAYKLVCKYLDNKNLIKHSLAVEIAMKHLARKLSKSEEEWGLAGLLHDLDYATTDISNHGKVAYEVLGEYDLSDEILNAIIRHPGRKDEMPQTAMDYALYSVDPLTGLIVASALMHPDKKIKSLDSEFVLRRFDEKRFASGANREQIKACENIDLKLDEFVTITLEAMKEIDNELGL